MDRNWRTAAGEIDLIVAIDGVIVFAEVKTRASRGFGGAVAAVGSAKQRRIRRLASEWLTSAQRLSPRSDGIRFDVVAVTGVQVEVWEGAF